jgi:hypothetical protein
MRIAYILLVLLICMPITLAEKDSVITGPFNISFDMGFPKNSYKIEIDDPVEKEELSGEKSTNYEVTITNMTGYNRVAIIDVKVDEQDQVIPTPEEIKNLLYTALVIGDYEEIQSAIREIDGIKGAISSGKFQGVDEHQVFQAEWYYSNKLQTTLTSSYPWEEGTLDLLKTIHIENRNQTDSAQDRK